MMTDPIADMLTRIRNANRIERAGGGNAATRLKENVAQVLKEEGFILDYQVGEMAPDEHGHLVFASLRRRTVQDCFAGFHEIWPGRGKGHPPPEACQPPGTASYRRSTNLSRPGRPGIAILSTSKGVMSDRKARAQRLGGELLCTVW